MVLNKLAIKKNSPRLKIYKYRNMLYRVELIITFVLKNSKVIYLVFLLVTLVTQLLSMHMAHVYDKGLILYFAAFL